MNRINEPGRWVYLHLTTVLRCRRRRGVWVPTPPTTKYKAIDEPLFSSFASFDSGKMVFKWVKHWGKGPILDS